jgi:ribosomal protein S18 acetylase RimI-like enzyme
VNLEWRHPTADDVPAWVELLRACEVVDLTGESYTEDDLLDEFNSPTHDTDNAWFAFAPGQLVGSGWAFGHSEVNEFHRVFLTGRVHPEWRRQGVGTEMLARLEECGRSIHHTLTTGREGVLEIDCREDDEGHVALAEHSGYSPLRYWFEMHHSLKGDLPPVLVPEGLELRVYSDEVADVVRAAHNEAFADHWGSVVRSKEEWMVWSVGRMFVPELSFVVLDGDDVAAYLLTHHHPADAELTGTKDGWMDTIGTRRAWRGRGLASAMIASALAAYRSTGFDVARLSVDADNPSGAFGLYERLGFSRVRTTISYAKPLE